MAAAGFREAERIRDDVDYTVSHRQPPPIPSIAYGSTAPGQAPVLSTLPGRPAHHPHQVNLNASQTPGTVLHRVPTESGATTAGASSAEEEQQRRPQSRRRGSLGGILRRNSDHTNKAATSPTTTTTTTTAANAPPLPVTRIAQAQQDAARARAFSSTGAASAVPPATPHQRKVSGESRKGNMLRKSSKLKQQQAAQAEQERLAREAAQNRPPPHLPSLNPLPNIASFGGEDARSLNNNNNNNIYNAPYAAGAQGPQPRTANFSRPATMSNNPSSSPAYAVRSGTAYTNSTSSPPPPDFRGGPAVAAANGEYAVGSPYDDRGPESMANRGRYSYASSIAAANSVNSPRRVRRRKDPTPFNVLVVGVKNSGKSSFISFLKHSLSLKSSHQQQSEPEANGAKSTFTSTYLETDMDGERVGLTIWDSAGLERNIVDLQLREMSAFVEAKFEETFIEEQKVMRTPGVKDTHIHCVFLLLDPVRLDTAIAAGAASKKVGSQSNTLADEDLQVMRALWGKTTVIPVISKADTLTVGHMAFLKRAVWQSLKGSKLDPLEALELEDDAEDLDEEEDEDEDEEFLVSHADKDLSEDEYELGARKPKNHKRQSSLSALNGAVDDDTPYIPMSILSPDLYDLPPYVSKAKAMQRNDKLGRRFPWGFADPHNAEHCDFGRLRDSIFSEWRSELRELSRTKWYENWRTSRLKNLPGSKQRVKGGVTPVAAVPREGRMVSGASPLSASHNHRQFSPPAPQARAGATAPAASSTSAAVAAIPRSVSSTTAGNSSVTALPTPPVGMAVTTPTPRAVSGAVAEPERHIPGSFVSADSYN